MIVFTVLGEKQTELAENIVFQTFKFFVNHYAGGRMLRNDIRNTVADPRQSHLPADIRAYGQELVICFGHVFQCNMLYHYSASPINSNAFPPKISSRVLSRISIFRSAFIIRRCSSRGSSEPNII